MKINKKQIGNGGFLSKSENEEYLSKSDLIAEYKENLFQEEISDLVESIIEKNKGLMKQGKSLSITDIKKELSNKSSKSKDTKNSKKNVKRNTNKKKIHPGNPHDRPKIRNKTIKINSNSKSKKNLTRKSPVKRYPQTYNDYKRSIITTNAKGPIEFGGKKNH